MRPNDHGSNHMHARDAWWILMDCVMRVFFAWMVIRAMGWLGDVAESRRRPPESPSLSPPSVWVHPDQRPSGDYTHISSDDVVVGGVNAAADDDDGDADYRARFRGWAVAAGDDWRRERRSRDDASQKWMDAVKSTREMNADGDKPPAPGAEPCSVCLVHARCVVCVPCGHVALCASCSNTLHAKALPEQPDCPLCRTAIVSVCRVYL